MKRGILSLLCAAVALSLTGCITKRDLQVNEAAAKQWLSSKLGKSSRINVSGHWYSPDWGGADLRQVGRNVTGEIGNFRVEGVVSGHVLYLTIYRGKWVDYTAMVKQTAPGRLEGYYSEDVPFHWKEIHPLVLDRVQM